MAGNSTLLPWLAPILLLSLALALIAWHRHSWRRAKATNLSDDELRFRQGQFRRRVQASSMLAMTALLLAVGLRISPRQSPSLYVWTWFGTALLLLWVILLALSDAVASRLHLRSLFRERGEALALLKAELERLHGGQDRGQ